jgi:N-acetylglutamate synthase-like GNAT family acetyltransferase
MFLRRLNPDAASDRQIAANLFLSTPDYELRNFGRLPSADTSEPLWMRFPPECEPEHRHTIAAFDRDRPVGLVQVGRQVPTSDCAALLLLLVPGPLQHQHVGCEIVERLSRQARRWPGISNWYVTVTESNTGALGFWRHCGFRTKTQGLVCEGVADRLTLMTRPIKGRPACLHPRATENDALVASRYLFARLP